MYVINDAAIIQSQITYFPQTLLRHVNPMKLIRKTGLALLQITRRYWPLCTEICPRFTSSPIVRAPLGIA